MPRRAVPPDIDRRVRELGGRQGGFVRDDQVFEMGGTPGYVRERLARGAFARRRPHVLLVGPEPHGLVERVWEVVLSVGGDAAVTGALGLHLLGVDVRGVVPRLQVVTSAHVRPASAFGVIQSTKFSGEPVIRLSGLPVASVARSILEMGVLTRNKWNVVNACHEAAFHRLLDLDALHGCVNRSTRRHGLTSVREGIELYEAGGAVTASDAERRFLELLITMGTPRALMNEWVRVHGVSFRVDAVWPALRCCIELDSPPHMRPPSRLDDDTRNRLLDHLGYLHIRVDSADLTLRRADVIRRIGQLLEAAAERAGVHLSSLDPF